MNSYLLSYPKHLQLHSSKSFSLILIKINNNINDIQTHQQQQKSGSSMNESRVAFVRTHCTACQTHAHLAQHGKLFVIENSSTSLIYFQEMHLHIHKTIHTHARHSLCVQSIPSEYDRDVKSQRIRLCTRGKSSENMLMAWGRVVYDTKRANGREMKKESETEGGKANRAKNMHTKTE